MGTLGNVPLDSAHGRCTAAALEGSPQISCAARRHVIIEYLQLFTIILVMCLSLNLFYQPKLPNAQV